MPELTLEVIFVILVILAVIISLFLGGCIYYFMYHIDLRQLHFNSISMSRISRIEENKSDVKDIEMGIEIRKVVNPLTNLPVKKENVQTDSKVV